MDRGHDPQYPDSLLTFDGRDDSVSKQDIRNIKRTIDKESWLMDDKDQKSVGKWIEMNPERVLYSFEYIQGPPGAPAVQEFSLALQSPLQAQALRKYAHGSVLALDSTFATNKYGVNLTFFIFA